MVMINSFFKSVIRRYYNF